MAELQPSIPVTVREAVIISYEAMLEWWEKPHAFFGGKTPKQAWEEGHHEEVMGFIEFCKTSDMN